MKLVCLIKRHKIIRKVANLSVKKLHKSLVREKTAF